MAFRPIPKCERCGDSLPSLDDIPTFKVSLLPLVAMPGENLPSAGYNRVCRKCAEIIHAVLTYCGPIGGR